MRRKDSYVSLIRSIKGPRLSILSVSVHIFVTIVLDCEVYLLITSIGTLSSPLILIFVKQRQNTMHYSIGEKMSEL